MVIGGKDQFDKTDLNGTEITSRKDNKSISLFTDWFAHFYTHI